MMKMSMYLYCIFKIELKVNQQKVSIIIADHFSNKHAVYSRVIHFHRGKYYRVRL